MELKLGIDNRKKSITRTCLWKLNHTFLYSEEVEKEITGEIRNTQMNENKPRTVQNLQPQVPRLKEKKDLKINNQQNSL